MILIKKKLTSEAFEEHPVFWRQNNRKQCDQIWRNFDTGTPLKKTLVCWKGFNLVFDKILIRFWQILYFIGQILHSTKNQYGRYDRISDLTTARRQRGQAGLVGDIPGLPGQHGEPD